jgi:hypothetical protein
LGEAAAAGWLATLIDWQERTRRSLERRLRAAHIGRFKPFCDFDWTWPKRCDRAAFEALMALNFLNDATNEWREVFPNAACVVSMVDRLVHNAEVLSTGPRRPFIFTSASCAVYARMHAAGNSWSGTAGGRPGRPARDAARAID